MFSLFYKDYLDHLHDLLLLAPDSVSIVTLLKSTLSYALHSVWLGFYYFISFQWATDFIDLPAVFKHNYSVILEGRNVLKSQYESGLDIGYFSFLDAAPLNSKSIFTGFLNSFFLCLPLSIPHLLSVRALITSGFPAGASAAFGTICGQLLFFSCILFGFEFILQPFATFEPLVIILGSVLAIDAIFQACLKTDFNLISIMNKKPLIKLFQVNFVLAWFEQICVANCFGNLTFTNSGTVLETTGGKYFLLVTITYVFGLLIGSIIWTFLFGIVIVHMRDFAATYLYNKTLPQFNQRSHFGLVVAMLVLAFSSFPYYGYDFFTAKTLGYISEDYAMKKVTPANRNKLSLDRSEQLTDWAMMGDCIFDVAAFHLQDERPLFETYGILSEKEYINREQSMDRIVEKTGNDGVAKKDYKLPFLINKKYAYKKAPRFETAELADSEFLFGHTSEDTRLLETMVNVAFRPNVYYQTRDRDSQTYSPQMQVRRIFRDKYYSNPIYKGLVTVRNATILTGEPKTSRLSANDEYSLFKRRIIFQEYLNSISTYRNSIEDKEVTYPEKVYNQQFKGSLNFIKHFNAVNLTEDTYKQKENRFLKKPRKQKTKVLKYDQPLFKQFSDVQNALLHEEIPLDEEDLQPSRFLGLNNTTPLYIGWDGSLRKFMVKGARIHNSSEDGVSLQTVINDDLDSNSVDLEAEPIPAKANQFLPDYYNFQAWAPGVENTDSTTKFKVPCLYAEREPILRVQANLELIDSYHNIDTWTDEDVLDQDIRLSIILNKLAMKDFFERLPLYDWYWTQVDDFFESDKYYFHIGDAVPPKLDGVAWPGQKRERFVVEKREDRGYAIVDGEKISTIN